jgi:hypothetical protein
VSVIINDQATTRKTMRDALRGVDLFSAPLPVNERLESLLFDPNDRLTVEIWVSWRRRGWGREARGW